MYLPQGRVGTIVLQQLRVGAGFGNAALVHVDDPVGLRCQIQIVGDHQRRAPVDEAGDGVAHHGLAGAIQSGGGLVQHHDGAAAQGQSGDGQTLALAA